MWSQTSSRRDDVSPYLTVSSVAGVREKIPKTFAHRVSYINFIRLSSLVCIGSCVHRGWSIERHRKSTDFGREGGRGGPNLAAPSTSARVQNRVEFVELARDMSSNWHKRHWDYRLEQEQAACTRGTTIVYTGYQGTTCVCYVSRMYEYSRMNMNISMSLFLLVR